MKDMVELFTTSVLQLMKKIDRLPSDIKSTLKDMHGSKDDRLREIAKENN
jgi:hypothetical protein